MKQKLLISTIILFVLAGTNVFAGGKAEETSGVSVIIEADTWVGEQGGKLQIAENRPGSTGNKCISYWDNQGHSVDWEFTVPVSGEYSMVFRYAQGRDYDVYRYVMIDGKAPSIEFAKFTLPPTGGFSKIDDNFKNVAVTANGQPVYVQLSAGKHKLTAIVDGAGNEKGSVNLDLIAFIGKGGDAEKVITALLPDSANKPGEDKKAVAIEPAAIKAFPTAEGFGAYSAGGRGGKIYRVTTLADGGPGSLREAVEAMGPRIVVFEVSGYIDLIKPLEINQGYITIAGQTAPGDGITLRYYPLKINADHVIMRYIRSRLSDTKKIENDAIFIAGGTYVILDHVSASWATDETLSASQNREPSARFLDKLTVQWSIIADSLNRSVHYKGEHGYGTLNRGYGGSQMSWHHNLWANHKNRMPRPGTYLTPEEDPIGPFFDYRNNVFYNWGGSASGYSADPGAICTYEFINNYYLPGPRSGGYMFNEGNENATAYYAGNWMSGKLVDDQMSIVSGYKESPKYLMAKPFAPEEIFTTESADAAFKAVIAKAGASLSRDKADEYTIGTVLNNTGEIIDSQDQVGGFPELKSLPAPADGDADGIPDAWEKANGLNPADPSDAAAIGADGYMNIEKYFNSIAP